MTTLHTFHTYLYSVSAIRFVWHTTLESCVMCIANTLYITSIIKSFKDKHNAFNKSASTSNNRN